MSDPSTPAHVLIVEDEPPMRRLLTLLLEGEGYRVSSAASAADGFSSAAASPPDLIVLDLGLPDRDGIALIEDLRSWSTAYILVVSAREVEGDKVAALDCGADDYLTKPFGSGELLARVRVGLRSIRSTDPAGAVIALSGLLIDVAKRSVTVDDRPVELTPLEFRLLLELSRHAGKALTHRHLLTQVWGPGASGRNHYVRVFIASLRTKLGDDPTAPRWIVTLPGIGYRMKAE